MLNTISPALCIRLRRHSNLTRKEFASRIGIGRDTLRNYEAGKTRPDAKIEQKMFEVARCTRRESADMLCDILSAELGIRVAVDDDESGYRPATPVANAKHVRRLFGGDLPEPRRRALDRRVHVAELMWIACESHDADLDDFADECRAEAESRRKNTTDAAASEPLNQGATGPATGGAPRSAEPVFHNAAPETYAPRRG